MRRLLTILGLALLLAAAASYTLWHRHAAPALAVIAPPLAAAEREVLYYQDPDGKPYYSAMPKKNDAGRDYVPVYEDNPPGTPASPVREAESAPKSPGKILYYRNPMGLPDTSPVPKKDSMGMDYLPVYEGEEPSSDASVKVSLAKVQRLGVRTEPAEMRELARTVSAVGTVQADERRQAVVSTKFEGWVEKLHVNATGQVVRRGQPLMDVYAPELVIAQQEYLLAWQALKDMGGADPTVRASGKQLADAALQRLKNWDISADQLRRLQKDGTARRTLTLRAPMDATVMEKTAVQGMRFAAGDPLYRLVDLSSVWIIADVFEQDLASVREGEEASVTVAAYPGATFTGKVAFVYPSVTPETRTAKVRIEVANKDGRLKTGMYATVGLRGRVGTGPVLAVPDSAVLNSGTRQVVLVDHGEGRFEPREVTLGAAVDGYEEITGGLKPGESVVVAANFLIDAESNLKAALRAFTPPPAEGSKP